MKKSREVKTINKWKGILLKLHKISSVFNQKCGYCTEYQVINEYQVIGSRPCSKCPLSPKYCGIKVSECDRKFYSRSAIHKFEVALKECTKQADIILTAVMRGGG